MLICLGHVYNLGRHVQAHLISKQHLVRLVRLSLSLPCFLKIENLIPRHQYSWCCIVVVCCKGMLGQAQGWKQHGSASILCPHDGLNCLRFLMVADNPCWSARCSSLTVKFSSSRQAERFLFPVLGWVTDGLMAKLCTGWAGISRGGGT